MSTLSTLPPLPLALPLSGITISSTRPKWISSTTYVCQYRTHTQIFFYTTHSYHIPSFIPSQLNGNVVNVKGRNQRDRYDGGLYNAAASAAAFASAITTPGQPSWTVQVYDNGLRRDSVAGFKAGQAPMPANSTAKFPKPLPGPYYKCPINTVRNTTITFKCGTPAFDPLAARFLEVVNVAEPSPCRFTADVITPNACTPDTGLCTAAPVSAPTPAVVG